jgi:hypothetical protein
MQSVGSAAIDAVLVCFALHVIHVLHIQPVGINEQTVDIAFRSAMEPCAVIESRKWIGDALF